MCSDLCNGVKKCFIQQNSCSPVEAAVPDKSPCSGRHLFVLQWALGFCLELFVILHQQSKQILEASWVAGE